MPKHSAGLLLYRVTRHGLEVFLVHPGGPYWAKKDAGAWSIPKGEFEAGAAPLTAARREFQEETGFEPPSDEALALEPVRQPGGKIVHAWAVEHDLDPDALRSGTFSMEWPPKSGKHVEFPEVDRGAWFDLDEASHKMLRGQTDFLEQLRRLVPD